jgi:pimeloyl-ACP methyl ester carboxylesterase
MPEQFVTLESGITLCYETVGSEGNAPLLLIMGLGTQMIAWPDAFCAQLAERGHYVIRFDNRDCGRSSRASGRPPSLRELVLRRIEDPPYTLSDMAADAVGLLDALGLASAHVGGASLGGMIAQTVAAEHPGRVRSLISVMSNTGSPWSGQPAFAIYRYLLRQAPTERDAYVAHMLRVFDAIGSTELARDHDRLRTTSERSYERGLHPAGTGRQLGAIVASGDRTAALRGITAPTLVIHGTRDRMVSPSGGRATARAIPGARLVMIDGMGHDLPEGAWPQLIEAIADHTQAADRESARASGAPTEPTSPVSS